MNRIWSLDMFDPSAFAVMRETVTATTSPFNILGTNQRRVMIRGYVPLVASGADFGLAVDSGELAAMVYPLASGTPFHLNWWDDCKIVTSALWMLDFTPPVTIRIMTVILQRNPVQEVCNGSKPTKHRRYSLPRTSKGSRSSGGGGIASVSG